MPDPSPWPRRARDWAPVQARTSTSKILLQGAHVRLALTAGAVFLLAPLAFAQQASPAQNQGRGVGQGLAAPPNGAQQGARGQQNGQAGGRGGRGQAPAGPAEPTPRWPDGKPRLGSLPGAKGIWNGG